MKTKVETHRNYKGIIVKAEYLEDYLIEVTFYDNTVRVVDLEKFFKSSKHPLIHKFYPINKFKQFRIEYGALAWGDNECDINPRSMYEGKYDAVLEYA